MFILKEYNKIIYLIVTFLIISFAAIMIKEYFKPFIFMIIIVIICSPMYNTFFKLGINKNISAVLSIISINIISILIILYLGNEILNIIKKIYISNIELLNKYFKLIADKVAFDNFDYTKSLFTMIGGENIKNGALSTGEKILAYFIANIAAFFILIDRSKIIDMFDIIIPFNILKKIKSQKESVKQMLIVEIILVLVSTIEILCGFIILRVPDAFMISIVCGILDILPYVGTIIVFIPIIIYNIVMKKFFLAGGLICLYILVQIVREVLEAKLLSSSLSIHPLVMLISIYVGINMFGMIGIIIGPIYSIAAKEIIFN
ncbi:AI-2E family transporter [Clostridium sp. BJN0001]|uniref:AI-2E family transporter n=1 Tax=Clostridium sp. BJN0001 TaxID=2930219 RepID=UPI001FD26096|nr:AI-2E family transporter [Clostridium sp. BJN0001]